MAREKNIQVRPGTPVDDTLKALDPAHGWDDDEYPILDPQDWDFDTYDPDLEDPLDDDQYALDYWDDDEFFGGEEDEDEFEPPPTPVLRTEGDRPIFHKNQILSLGELQPGTKFKLVYFGKVHGPYEVTIIDDDGFGLGKIIRYRDDSGPNHIFASDSSVVRYRDGTWNTHHYLIHVDD